MWNAGLHESEVGIKIAGRKINNLRYADDTALMAESEEELFKEPLDEDERGEWKALLKLNIHFQLLKSWADGSRKTSDVIILPAFQSSPEAPQ